MSQLYPFCPLLCGERTNILIEHLKNCKNKNLLGVKYFQCEYNPIHIFGKKAYEKHIKKCPDKYKNNNIFNVPKENEKINETEKEEKNDDNNNDDNIIFEDIDDTEKEYNYKRTSKRSNTSTFLDKNNKNSTFKELFLKNEKKIKRKNSDSLEKYKEHIKEENLLGNEEIVSLKENLKKIEFLKENKIKIPEKKNLSFSNLNMKGILKNKLEFRKIEKIKNNYTLEKGDSSFRSYNSASHLFKNFEDENSSIKDESSDDENINIQRKNVRRYSSKSVSFKGLVKVFVFNHNNNEINNKKIEPKRSTFAKSSIKNNINEKDSDKEFREIYMKKL